MKNQLETIYQKKTKNKNTLISLKNKYLVEIYRGAVYNSYTKNIHKKLYDMTINKKVYSKTLYDYCVNNIVKVKNKKSGVEGTVGIDLMIIALLNMSSKCDKIINSEVSKAAEEEKLVTIDEAIETARKYGKLFYLASSHNDCAEDHKKYQGKMYVDKMWWQLTRSNEIRNYVKNHNLRTVQWVMGSPAYFITRPNCRHYFQSLSADEVLHNSIKKLKKKYNTHDKTGRSEFQTKKNTTLEQYREQLKLLEQLNSVKSTLKLRQRIEKIKMLIKKWESK